MENRDRTTNQGGQGQGSKLGQGSGKPSWQSGGQKPRDGEQADRERQVPGGTPNSDAREGQEASKQGGRPSPSGVPNEGKGSPGQPGSNDDRGRNVQSGYQYKGGRQSTGGTPNPDDRDDDKSAGSFRRTEELEPDPDADSRNPG